jgi:hypothetical protein
MHLLLEGFDHMDLENQVIPKISIDEYSAKTGTDDEIVTVAFTIKGQQASKDLVEWFERGYTWVIDAAVSDGELSPGKYLVFVEMNRRTSTPNKIVELVEDLETLTGLKVKDWTVTINDEEFDCEVSQIKSQMILSPQEYRETKEEDLNEMRTLSGSEPKKLYGEHDSILKDFISKAGL